MPQLTMLDCSYTAIEELDVRHLTSLESLSFGARSAHMAGEDASDTIYPLKRLVLGSQLNLNTLGCSYTQIQSLDLSGCPNIKILNLPGNKNLTSLDVTHVPNLASLSLTNSAISKLDLSKCTQLTELMCDGTEIEELDLRSNSDLRFLDCSNTKLRTLDVSKNPSIQILDCSYTDIGELDLSNLKALTLLSIAHSSVKGIAFSSDLEPNYGISLGKDRLQNTLVVWTAGTELISANADFKSDSDVKMYFTEYEQVRPIDFPSWSTTDEEENALKDSFMDAYSSEIVLNAEKGKVDLKDYCSVFDPQRVLNMEGASITGSVLSDITPGQPVTYTYCMERALTEKDREFVESEPEQKEQMFTEEYNSSKESALEEGMTEEEFEELWKEIYIPYLESVWGQYWESEIVRNLGLSENSIMTVTLNISVTNAWEQELTIEDITYGGTPSPSAVPLYGKDAVKYVYSTQKDGDYTENVPVTAGTYWVKAVAPAGEGYAEITSDPVPFEIQKAVPKFEVPSGLTAKEGQTLKDVKLPAGFTWADESQSVGKAGTHTFKAVYTPEDTVNYKIVEGIEIKVQVSADAVSGGSGSTGDKDNTADNGKNTTPLTGVSEYPWLWLGILALSGGTLGLTAWKKRRQL